MKIMPRISGRSSLTTTSLIRLRPSVRSVSRWFGLRPIPDRTWVTFSFAIPPRRQPDPAPPRRPARRSIAAGATSSTGRPRRAATASGGSSFFSAATVACTMLIGLDEPEALGEHVVDAGALQHRPHRAAGDDAGTGAGRLEQHDAGGVLTLHRVRDGGAIRGTLKKCFLASSTPLAIAAGTSLALP